MTRSELATAVRKIADMIESGDSAEGRIAYCISDSDPSGVDVDIAVRTGNLDGQGGYEMINTMPPESCCEHECADTGERFARTGDIP